MASRVGSTSRARLIAWGEMSDQQRERELVKLWRIRRTVYQMLHDRGYLVAASELNQSLADFRRFMVPGSLESFSYDSLMIVVGRKDDPATQTIVFFNGEPQIGVQPLRKYGEKMRELSAQSCIVVYRGTTSGFVRHTLADYKETMQVFEEEELIVNITEHSLVPKHVVLSDDEKKQLLERYRLKITQLPRILLTDPVARYYGLRRGQVVKIIRPSETAGRYVTFRVCF